MYSITVSKLAFPQVGTSSRMDRQADIDQCSEPCKLETSWWVTEVSELMNGGGKWLQVFVISTLVIVSVCRWLIRLMMQVVPWHYPPPPRASPDARDRRRGRPRPLGAGRLGWAWWKSLMRDGSRMSSLFAHDLSSGPYPSQSMRYWSRPPHRLESRISLTV